MNSEWDGEPPPGFVADVKWHVENSKYALLATCIPKQDMTGQQLTAEVVAFQCTAVSVNIALIIILPPFPRTDPVMTNLHEPNEHWISNALTTLLVEMQVGIDRFKSSGRSEASRVDAQEKAIQWLALSSGYKMRF
jgi:hypothetical protein